MAPRRLASLVGMSIVTMMGMTLPGQAAPGGMLAGAHHGLSYTLHVPPGADASAPMVVMLHGCTQDPDQFATSTRMNALADQEGFLVLYPGQSPLTNPRRCWNWFLPLNQRRGQGEPALIANLVLSVAGKHRVDPQRVYVAGLSAGGAMAAILAANYPDVFAAVGVVAGLPFAVAHDTDSALAAMAKGAPHPTGLGQPLLRALGGKPVPPIMIMHGSDDPRVIPRNGDELAAQWVSAAQLSAAPSETTTSPALPDTRAVERAVWRDAQGQIRVERWLITGLGHAWPGGDPKGTHVDPVGPAASDAFWRFFKDRRLAP